MSSGIGFAGLGKYLNDKSLSLLKGRKHAKNQGKYKDERESKTNNTNYKEIFEFKEQHQKRRKKITRAVLLVVVILIILVVVLF